MTTYQALLHRFQVVCDDATAASYLREILAPLEVADDHHPGLTEYRLTHGVGARQLDELWVDGTRSEASTRGPGLIGQLLARIDHDAEQVTGQKHTVLHAAACHLDGHTLLIPGAPNAGKSTLVAYLSLQGWTYLSDELLAVLPGPIPQVLAYPRTIVLDPGSWRLFGGHLIEPPRTITAQIPHRRHLALPRDSRVEPSSCLPITDVLLYRWPADDGARVEELDVVEGLRTLLGSSFSLQRRPDRDLERLSHVVERTACWQATTEQLAELEPVLRKTLKLHDPATLRSDVR